MLRFLKTYETKDFSRDAQYNLGYGVKICQNNRSVQWHGAYSDSEGIIEYFQAKSVNSVGVPDGAYYELDVDCITYANGQYNYDPESFYGGTIPEGFYYLEFNDGVNTFYSEMFCVKCITKPFIASGDWLASGSFLVSSVSITCNDDPLERKYFEEIDFYEFE